MESTTCRGGNLKCPRDCNKNNNQRKRKGKNQSYCSRALRNNSLKIHKNSKNLKNQYLSINKKRSKSKSRNRNRKLNRKNRRS